MANNVQVSLSFTADTAKARTQLQELQKSINQLGQSTVVGKSNAVNTLSTDTQKALRNVAQLEVSLKKAVDVNTGKLDLTKFNQSLKDSGMTLKQYRDSLVALGPAGEKAFLNLGRSIMNAEAPLQKVNGLLNSFWNSLKQTAKYQISASVFRGFTSGISSAFNYAQDLNESLNNIRIVTGKSVENMADFAKQANKAAKELSTTTTAYTDASLIYYQQGLSDTEVKERADITIKAANAAGTQTAEMADYLTAVWNSYKVGAEDLERYVDIMAALGAGTATSLEEISTSMEKVASVGEATGVKFEQLSSIIATVSSVTRTSAESVGTAYKTIFARMADLELEGSVEEDGVTTSLGKVSEQLAQVGVNILDANGDLREMGTVLEELMGKWNNMNGATQQAVAIALAGKRQYTQLLALMNNQDMYFDAMNMAENSEGTVDKQADIYAESWEGAKKRVQASAQGIYDSLINDEFFIDLNNLLADALSSFEKLIDGVGGLKGVLITLGPIFTAIFQKQIISSINNTVTYFKNLSGATKREAEETKKKTANLMMTTASASVGDVGGEKSVSADIYQKIGQLQLKIIQNADKISEKDRETLQVLLDQNQALADNIDLQVEQLNLARQNKENLSKEEVIQNFKQETIEDDGGYVENFEQKYSTTASQLAYDQVLQGTVEANLSDLVDTSSLKDQEKSVKNLKNSLTALFAELDRSGKTNLEEVFGKDVNKNLNSLIDKIEEFEQAAKESPEAAEQALKELQENVIEQLKKSINDTQNEFEELGAQFDLIADKVAQEAQANAEPGMENQAREEAIQTLADYRNSVHETANAEANLSAQNASIQGSFENINGTVDEMIAKLPSTTDSFMALGQILGNVSSGVMSLIGMFQALNNEDMSASEKFITVLTTMGMLIPSVISTIGLLNKEQLAANVASIAAATGFGTEAASQTLLAFATGEAATATMSFGAALWSVLWPIGLIIAAIGALVAIIYGIVKAVEAQKAASPEGQMKAAAEEAEKAAEAYEEVAAAVNDVTDSFNKLKSAQEKIETLTKGTQEWRDAIYEANQQALELLNIFPKLAEGMETNKDGLIIFSKEIIEEISKQQQKKLLVAAGSKNSAQQKAREKEIDYEISILRQKDFDTRKGKTYDVNSGTYKENTHYLSSEKIDSIISLLDKYGNELWTASIDNSTQQAELANALQLDLKDETQKNILNEIIKNHEQFDNIHQSQEENNSLTDAGDKMIANQIAQLEGFKGASKEDTEWLAKREDEIYNELNSLQYNKHVNYDFNKKDQNNKVWSSILKDFMAEAFSENKVVSYKAQAGGDAVFNVDGEEKPFSKEDIIRLVSSSRAQKAFSEERLTEKQNSMQNLKDSNINLQAFEEAIMGDYSEMRKQILSSMKPTSDFDEKEFKSDIIPNDKKNDLEQVYGETVVNQIAKIDREINDVFSYQGGGGYSKSELLPVIKDILSQAQEAGQYENMQSFLTTEGNWLGMKDMQAIAGTDFTNLSTEQIEEMGIKLGIAGDNLQRFVEIGNGLAQNGLEKLEEYIGESVEKYDLDEDVLREQAALLESNIEGLEGNKKAATEMAVANQRLNKGVDALTDNWEDWKKTLTSSDKTTQDYAEAIVGVKNAMKDILNLPDDAIIPEGFLESSENLDLLEQIGDGSEEAVKKLYFNLSKAQIEAQEFSSNIAKNMTEAFDFGGEDIDLAATFEAMKNEAISALSEIQAAANEVDIGKGLKDPAKQAEWAQKLNEYALAVGMSAEQMQSFLSSVGVTAQIDMVEGKPITKKIPITKITRSIPKITYSDEHGIAFEQTEDSQVVGFREVEEPTLVPQIKMNPEGESSEPTKPIFNKISMGNISPSVTTPSKKSGGGGGGGGGSKSSKAPQKDIEKFEKTRYKNTDNLLESQARNLSKIQKLKDQVYGKKYIDAIDEEISALKRENEILEMQREEAENYLNQDVTSLANLGYHVQLDENNVLLNYEELEAQLYEQEVAAINAYNAAMKEIEGDESEGAEDKKEAIEDEFEKKQEGIEEVKSLLDSLEEASKKYYDNTEKREENLQQIREDNYEKITHKLEKLLQITENENKLIEVQSSLLEESFKNAPELFDNNLKTTENMLNDLDHYRNLYKEIQSLSSDELADPDRMDGIQQAFDGILDTVSSLTEQADYFKNAYSEALGQVQEEAEKLYSQFDHFISLTENYENILGLLNRSTDYETLNNILKARQQLQQDQYQASKEDYEMLLGQIAQARQAQAAALGRGDQAAADVYKNTIESLTIAVHEAQATMIDNVQAWLEGIAQVRDTAIAAAREVLENSLTNGSTFNEFNQELEYLQAKQEDYLTETNQQYETQKLIRTAMLDIEKTENQVAKNKLNAYIKETEELQKQERLSNFELEIQQAKYDLLLAEIALQEAQGAKSQVRLQRDSEGNFNYVYTADQDKIAEAESKYADAENNLYNIRLEGANEYAQKYYELMQEMADKMAEIQEDETLSTEEKNRRMEELYDQYYSRLKDMQSIYNIAAIGLDDDLNEAVSANMMDNIASLDDFKEATEQYLSDCEDAQNEWQANADTVSDLVSGDFQDVKDKSGELKRGIDDLRIDSEKNLNSMQLKTQSWAEKMAGHLQSVKAEAISLANAFQKVLAASSGFSNTDYMAQYDSATDVIDAFSSLNARDFKIANNKELADQYGTTTTALMESDRDQTNQIKNASTKEQAIAAAARREAKLEYLKRNDIDLYNELIKGFRTEDLLANEKLNISREEASQLIAEMRRQLQYFDTGGYTGEFGPEGKLAVLHQKEIVLNNSDTANLLETVDIVRKLIDNIEYKALMSSFGNVSIPTFGNTDKETLEQEVTIHAEFPNVQNSNEIEEAFNNLINRASQYANRKSY